MTLVLAWKAKNSIVVIADTHFSGAGGTASEIGPKIFVVPIQVTGLAIDKTISLPQMGFAFAGDSSSGQFTHAMATVCLSHLCSPTINTRPTVHDVASFYASCAIRLVQERRRHRAFDSYTFEGIIFGQKYSFGDAKDDAEACHFRVFINPDGECASSVALIDFETHPVFAIGSGAHRAKEMLALHAGQSPGHAAVAIMDQIISGLEEASVGGCVQGAVANGNGAEIRTVLRHNNRIGEYYGVMGLSEITLGKVADYAPVGVPLLLDDIINNPNAEI